MQYASSIGSLVSHIVQKIILFLDLEHATKNTNKNKKWKGIDISFSTLEKLNNKIKKTQLLLKQVCVNMRGKT